MTIYIAVLDGIHWLEYKKHRNKNFKRIIKLEYRKKPISLTLRKPENAFFKILEIFRTMTEPHQ